MGHFNRLSAVAFCVCAFTQPALAENFLTPFANAINELTQPAPQHVTPRPQTQTAPKPLPRPVEAQTTENVELPRPRPQNLGGPTPATAETLPEPEVSTPVPVVPPVAAPPAEAPPAEASPAEPAPKEPVEARIYQTACPALTMGAVEGKILPPISEGQCFAQSPLSLTSVSVNGRMVPLSGEVTTDCAVATMLPGWLSAVDGYVWAKDNTHIAGVNIGTTYMCRNRVGGSSTDKLSEHGFADALDVVGFTLDDGRTVNVETGWPGTEEQGSAIVRYAHDAACSRFMTTLGPEANAEHHDHIHVDMGCHGKTCTARLCE